MEVKRTRLPGILGVVASTLGLFFSAFSTHDYALHLDRQLHNTHCSFVPGLAEATSGANACTAAMYSPYSALFRDKYWGGVPISLFALGAYAFFLALSVYILVAGSAASKRAWQAFGLTALTPVLASGVMFFVSLTKLGAFCKLCVGLYGASGLLAAAGVLALLNAGGKLAAGGLGKGGAEDTLVDAQPPYGQPVPPGYPEPAYAMPAPPPPLRAPGGSGDEPGGLIPVGGFLVIPALLAVLGAFSAAPAAVYIAALPDYSTYLGGCGTLAEQTEKHNALVKLPTSSPVQPALMLVDPLCPTCKAFHDRLVSEGIFERLDVTVAIFPLDNDCNWMLDRALHPGACVLAKAFLCADKPGGSEAKAVLEWSYANQEELTAAGKSGKDVLRARVKERFPDVDACIDAKETKQRLDHVLHFAIANKVQISTPQLFLGEKRVCDEDTDLGLRYTVGQIAPQVNQP
jgi:uncharacterized membrane protein